MINYGSGDFIIVTNSTYIYRFSSDGTKLTLPDASDIHFGSNQISTSNLSDGSHIAKTNDDINLDAGKVYKIDGVEVLSSSGGSIKLYLLRPKTQATATLRGVIKLLILWLLCLNNYGW